ncbi:MAG: protein-L-isoaspartate(D-aspartate) O-methyltransferase [Nitrospirae bacterium]|nr:MAG: protein-L-isoaspartate(D-aspartate) O-methyltransferase [Nitrospirota bacterium]
MHNEREGVSPQSVRAATGERQAERERMVAEQIIGGGITDTAVIEAMRRVPRHRFVPDTVADEAYEDHPLPIGFGQTISQPFIVAYMTQALKLKPNDKVLEVGTGSGYQAAVLAEIVSHVYTIEIVEPLAKRAEATLRALGYQNVHVRVGDGYQGWPEEAPFDAIIVTAAPDHVPQPLLDQLAIGGRMILPVGKFVQELVLIRRTEKGFERTTLLPVAFVPMTGEAEKKKAAEQN